MWLKLDDEAKTVTHFMHLCPQAVYVLSSCVSGQHRNGNVMSSIIRALMQSVEVFSVAHHVCNGLLRTC